ncbi:mannose-1-phosphate guanylyltransferase/mannose-6-phosphate isomerase [Sphingomonas parva]|uniref:mannose-1-phosphate guanylyltransferase n=1 Tax=Sphingomonas parva TaxID=2555898 RepID=A0A4Y8ZPK9_9SPHN|nr:mannose-1-phosphate guanylyltransferase/mannose-6-phosphate isomerase [Sphingomonas parva]TFI57192.1 mannose-1-phosphate guanylyltransferase/mannose-6-phosphate isomerase [Sphingomonas parva]
MSSAADRTDRRVTPVILSGGSGTRLWPLSRADRPKQMLPLLGDRPMLRMTLDRVADDALFSTPVVVASESQVEQIAEQIGDADAGTYRLILEPAARNTAPAITLAAMAAAPDDLLLVMPSDHLIGDPAAFTATVRKGIDLAERGALVTFGIRPTRPETGYGYIRQGAPLGDGAFRVERFVEKPDAERAAAYLAAGDYHWNAGIFLFRAETFLQAVRSHAPAVAEACAAALAGIGEEARVQPDPACFAAAPSISIDYAVMEHADNIAVVPMSVPWSDVGSWQSLYEVSPSDESGNSIAGDCMMIRSTGCLARSDGPLVVAIGVTDLAIIATPDAVLIVPRENSQDVKDAIDLLKSRDDPRL